MTSVTRIIIRRRRRRAQHRRVEALRQFWLLLFGVLMLLFVVAPLGLVLGSAWVTYADAIALLPEPQETTYLDPAIGSTRIYDSTGRTLLFAVEDPLGDQRTWIDLERLPDYVAAATLLAEDPFFLERPDFSPVRLVNRLWSNWLSARPAEVDASITGRLVRNAILRRGPDNVVTHDDRALEIALIAEVNRLYTPEDILEWHLNTNYYGSQAYGIEAAAQVYLGKSATELTIDEAALLAAIPTASQFNLIDEETIARDRQSDMLRRMLSSGVITQSEFQQVINVQTPIRRNAGQVPEVAPDFAMYAREQAETILDNMGMDGAQLVSRGGLRIITTLDMDLYEQTECTLQTHLARLRGQPVAQPQTRRGSQCLGAVFLPETPPAPQLIPPDDGAVVIIDARTGELLTMNGTGVQPIYQPGPVLYPFVYLHGFINPDPFYTAASMLLDIPRPFAGRAEGSILIPTNPNDTYYGPLSLRDAMGSGLVPPAMEVANTLNINAVIRQTANRMGINTLREGDFGLDLLERGGAISLLDVAYTYAVFAGMGETSGIRVEPVAPGLRDHDAVAIRRIEDTAGNILWQYDDDQKALSRVLVLQEQLAYVVNDILSDQRTRWRTLGQGNILEMPRQPAVVNGITADQVDNWTVGYTPQMVVAVQLDRADRGATSLDGFALDGAATVWRALMEYVHGRDSLPIAAWDTPEAIVATPVCEISGLSPTDACETRNEIFLDPAQFPPRDTYWELVEINTQTGERASRTTPAALRSMAAYFIPPEEAMDWWRANGRPLPPVAVDTASRGDLLSSVVILQPGNYDTVGGVVDIRGAMDDTDLAFWQLTYGEGANPQEWIPLTEPQETFVPGTSLALWDTSGLDGTYVLQLQMVRSDNTVEDGFVQVVVDNRPPSVVLTAGEPGQTFNWPSDQTIPLVAEVADNIRVSRVDFYHNGQFITSDDSFPFEYAHPISRTGRETFTAVVYDAVENSSEATLEVEVVRQDG